ncbi:MAG TPA: hypothetical protein VN670_05650 [Acidobacteriaceae bacterium]|nr:hypothetical protein [Acidobacteriaceae bacterium]
MTVDAILLWRYSVPIDVLIDALTHAMRIGQRPEPAWTQADTETDIGPYPAIHNYPHAIQQGVPGSGSFAARRHGAFVL